ncbi:MAG: hypothetical protein UT24_C0016G0055 [Candidatus Woesebacteria bacterium GW2011_GWB1_39_12]|uniref:Uncharacterized protein n=1 Tax=Candidatus Woesebacteria bacterium GW2011_GWB1_39_12 TaxID=1618574 RepID=A0A0G0MIJ5_9BACT|nr:MAG: hypothetical protein UT24_C0016G0055 [Candidatus Woesebacteria bacterium GW2011_GWB1_39_12]
MEKAKRKQIDIEWNQRKEANRFHNLALLGVNHISRETLEKLVRRKSWFGQPKPPKIKSK